MLHEPRIIEVDEIKFVGMDLNHNVHDSAAGGDPGSALWAQFAPLSEKVRHSLGCYIGVCGPVLEGGLSNYTAAVQVSQISDVPANMVSGVLPAGRYAQFFHLGPISKIWQTVDFIHNQWMPKAGYKDHDCRQIEIYAAEGRAPRL